MDTVKAKKLINWLRTKIFLQEKNEQNNFTNWFTPRGGIYTCLLGENIGDEKSGLRPILVVSSDKINRKSGNVIVVTLSKTIKWKDNSKIRLKYSTHYVLKRAKYNKLTYDSAVQCEDMRVVSKARLGDLICFVDSGDLKEINKRLKDALQL